MRRFVVVVIIALLAAGCTSAHPDSIPTDPVVQKVDTAPAGGIDSLAGLSLRDIVADSTGKRFLVQDADGTLMLVSASGGRSKLGEAPEIGLLAAWGENDYGFAFARKATADSTYEIVGVGHAGSKVLATAVGYPGAITFVGQAVHFIDAEGWKAVTWSGSPVLKAPLSLGPRANQRAWCNWAGPEPICLGGYWDPAAETAGALTVLRAGEPAHEIMTKGPYPILGAGAVSPDGRLAAAGLGTRSSGREPGLGTVVVAWLDEAATPVKTREFPVLARTLFFDAYGRLIAHVFPEDGSGHGQIVMLNPDDGSTLTLGKEAFGFAMAPDRKRLYIMSVAGGVTELPLNPGPSQRRRHGRWRCEPP